MALARDFFLSLGGTDLSSFVRSLDFTEESEQQSDTTMGATAMSTEPGLVNSPIDITFKQDFGLTGPDEVVGNGVLNFTTLAVEVRPFSTAVAVGNPKRTGNVVVSSYNPIDGSVGDELFASCTLVPAGDITRATA